jgi:hypothetical protein|tara:strand:+ start:273 stop:887 length:615 start_codon:yes stop_codon:yes gene_type:complete
MNVYDIISEDKIINEAPTSGVGNAIKGAVGKLPGAERIAGNAEMGKEANALYKTLKKWQGINGKNDKNMTDQDFGAFMKQNKLSAGGITLPAGTLDKKTVMDVLKQAAKNKLTGGNAAAAPDKQPAGKAKIEPTVGNSVLDKMQAKTGKKGTAKKTPGAKAPATGNAAGTKAPPVGKPAKIDPKLQATIDSLSVKQRKELAGML